MQTWKILGFLGIAPFIICLYLYVNETWLEQAKFGFVAYSAIILSFLSGSLWRVEFDIKARHQVISNVFSLLAFASLFIDKSLALLTLSSLYMLLFIYEVKGFTQRKTSTDYKAMRFRLTLLVVSLHIVAYVLW